MTAANTGNPVGDPTISGLKVTPAPDQQTAAEFDRFKDLARRLVKVPKTALDTERQKS